MEWSRKKYNEYYNSYVPWLEDKYLAWRGENKTSYVAKDQMKTDVTGVQAVKSVQSGAAEAVGGQLDDGGLLGGVGKASSQQGMNRFERGEHNDAAQGVQGEVDKQQKGWGETLTGGMIGGGSGGEKKK